jgi:hypothetical protein
MDIVWNVKKLARTQRNRSLVTIGTIVALLLGAASFCVVAADADKPPVVKIAVFDFELDDVSAAGAASTGESASDITRMQVVSGEARRVLAQSGRYKVVDTNSVGAEPAKQRSLRNCNGCDASIALKLGAEQSLIGVVTRVANTEYYVSLVITDAKTGKVINQQSAFFTGADDAWASGVRMVIKHGVLPSEN